MVAPKRTIDRVIAELADRNVRAYPRVVVASHVMPWLPVHYLLLVDRFGLGRALGLGGIYYLAVVAAEVPTGRLSDRRGRVPALRLCGWAWLASHLLIALAPATIVLVALAEVLRAVGFAALSGSDVALHQDALEALGRGDEIEAREAVVRRRALAVSAGAVVIGGAAGAIDLRLPFLLGAVAAVALLRAVGRLTPTAERRVPTTVRSAARHLAQPLLTALAAAVVVQVILQHVVAEVGQAYLDAVVGSSRAPVSSGAVVALSLGFGSLAAGWAPALRRRLGLLPALLGLAAVPATVVVLMALHRHVALVPLLALRSAPMAAAEVLVATTVVRAVAPLDRSTVLSLMSLAGRLCYGGVLLVLSRAGGLAPTLRWAALAAVLLVFGQAVHATRAVTAPDRDPAPTARRRR